MITNRRSWHTCLRFAAAVGAVAFLALWLAGRSRYTSVGWDAERLVDGRVERSYYRLRWPGNGELWVGGGTHARSPAHGPPEAFDLASTFFDRPPHRPTPANEWNRNGWWWLPAPASDPCDRGGAPLVRGSWLGVPGWLPAAILGLWPAVALVRRVRRAPKAAESAESPAPGDGQKTGTPVVGSGSR